MDSSCGDGNKSRYAMPIVIWEPHGQSNVIALVGHLVGYRSGVSLMRTVHQYIDELFVPSAQVRSPACWKVDDNGAIRYAQQARTGMSKRRTQPSVLHRAYFIWRDPKNVQENRL